MKKYICIVILISGLSTVTFVQKYYSKTAHVSFLSQAPIETIEANNNNAYIVFDASTGQIEFSVLIKGFSFQKALMQEHFNENYMESDKYPKSTFKGSLLDWSDTKLMNDHVYNVNVNGDLTIHGVAKQFNGPAKLTVKDGVISAFATFDVTIADYQIEVPKVVRDNISKTVKVTVKADLQPLK